MNTSRRLHHGPRSYLAPRALAIAAGTVALKLELTAPDAPRALVLLAEVARTEPLRVHDRRLVQRLAGDALAVLRVALAPEGALDAVASPRDARAPLAVLGAQLAAALDWARAQPVLAGLPLGLLGSGAAALAAFSTAAERADAVRALVSYAAPLELASAELLAAVRAPTLLVVAAHDTPALSTHCLLAEALRCRHQLAMVGGAGHDLRERGAMEHVTTLALEWFAAHLVAPAAATAGVAPTRALG